ncbi:MAG: insulinase family protein [Bacteroidales bacterium]|nr:insulinase family protein [Bacteroidales bacterium]
MKNPGKIQPPVFPPEEILFPEVKLVTLSGGVPVYTIESGTEDVVRAEFTFRAGQAREDIPLLASTVNMMLTEGSQRHSSEEISSMLDFHGSFINPYCEKDRAGFVIFFLPKYSGELLKLAREIVFEPAFPEKELRALMNKRLRWFLTNREKVQNLASDKFYESVFGNSHPYGRQTSEPDFEGISSELTRVFHKTHYNLSNLAVILSGRFRKDTIEMLEDLFSSPLTEPDLPPLAPLPEKGKGEKDIYVHKQNAVQTSIRIGSRTINKRHPDYPGLKVLNMILGGYFGSRLMRNIREEKGLTYGISSSLTSLDLSGFKVISTDVSNENRKLATDEIYMEIDKLRNIEVEEAELGIVRNYMSGEMLRMFDGPFALAESFRAAWEFGLDNDYYRRLAEKIKSITPDEIKALANTYYNIEELYEISAGDR